MKLIILLNSVEDLMNPEKESDSSSCTCCKSSNRRIIWSSSWDRYTKKLTTALKRLGFDGVFDTNFAA